MNEVRNLPELDSRTTRQFYNSSHVPFEPEPNALRIQYNNKAEFKRAAKLFGLMDDFKVCGLVFAVLVPSIMLTLSSFLPLSLSLPVRSRACRAPVTKAL